MATLPVLSLYQPWASWCIGGRKTIETRTHNRYQTLRGQTIAIHAALTYDKASAQRAARFYLHYSEFCQLEKDVVPCHQPIPFGSIIGTVEVYDFRRLTDEDSPAALIYCGDPDLPRFGLLLRNPRPLVTPIQIRGRQGIWHAEIPDDAEFQEVQS